jgi:hypothetical protein
MAGKELPALWPSMARSINDFKANINWHAVCSSRTGPTAATFEVTTWLMWCKSF